MYPNPNNIALIQGTDINNNFDTAQLTQVTNDPYAAPGALQPYLYKGQLHHNYGSSYSAPLWSSAIAMVIAFNPSLNAVQANQIVLTTGTPVVGSSCAAKIPNFYQAILYCAFSVKSKRDPA